MNQIEMRVSEIQLPPPIKWNREEIKLWLSEILAQYEGLVYSDEQLKDAKADKAKLNKLRKALNDERIRYQKQYMSSFDTFKAEVDEVLKMIDSTTFQISAQLEEAEKKRREEKADAVSEIWNSIEDKPDWLDLGAIYNDKWLNASYSLNQVREDLKITVEAVNAAVMAISRLPEYSFEALEEYKRTLDLPRAIKEGERLADIQRRKEEAERIRKEEQERRQKEAAEKAAQEAQLKAQIEQEQAQEPQGPQVTHEWISFKVYVTYEEAMALKIWLNDHNITFKPI